jgi:hypothetical protein
MPGGISTRKCARFAVQAAAFPGEALHQRHDGHLVHFAQAAQPGSGFQVGRPRAAGAYELAARITEHAPQGFRIRGDAGIRTPRAASRQSTF